MTVTGESYKGKWIVHMNSTISLSTSMWTFNYPQMIMLKKVWSPLALSADYLNKDEEWETRRSSQFLHA
jgi:hypothetical protein